MEVKKSSLIFFLYALVMFWPDYFFFGMIKYLENLLAAYAVIYVYNNRKRISGLSIIVIIYFTYFLLDTFLQGRGDIHTLISNAKIALFFVVTDVQFEKEKYDTVNIMWWFVFVFSLMNFFSLILFPNGLYRVETVWNEWGTKTSAPYWILGFKNSQAFWYLLLEILALLKWYLRPTRINKFFAYGCAIVAVAAQLLVRSSTATVACIVGAIGIWIAISFERKNVPMATAMSFVVSFFLTPFITNMLGTEAYGFVTLSKNFVSYAVIISTALDSYATRYIAMEYHKRDFDKANSYVSSAFYGDTVIASIIFAVGVIFVLFMERFLNVSPELLVSVKLLFLLVFVNFFFTTIKTVFNSTAYIKNRLDITGFVRVIGYVVEIILYLVIFKLFPPRVWYVGIVMLVVTAINFLAAIWMFHNMTPELKVERKLFSMDAVKKLVGNGIWNSINSLGVTLNSGLDLLVTNLLLTNLQMGQIAITKTIASIFSSLEAMLCQPFQPLLLKSYSDNNKEQLLDELKMSVNISGFFSALTFAGFFSLGQLFYKLWIPNQDIELLYALTVVTILAYVTEGPVHPLYYIYTLTVKNRVPCIITLLGGVLNVVGMFVLVRYTNMGIYSIVITTTIITTVTSMITNPPYMAHCLKLKWYTFYPMLLINIIGSVIMTVLFSFVAKAIAPSTWVGLIVTACILSIFGLGIYFIFVFSNKERKYIINMIKRKANIKQ